MPIAADRGDCLSLCSLFRKTQQGITRSGYLQFREALSQATELQLNREWEESVEHPRRIACRRGGIGRKGSGPNGREGWRDRSRLPGRRAWASHIDQRARRQVADFDTKVHPELISELRGSVKRRGHPNLNGAMDRVFLLVMVGGWQCSWLCYSRLMNMGHY